MAIIINKKLTINTSIFIKEIERRPALWNPCSEGYQDKDIKRAMWKELTTVFGKNIHDVQKKMSLGVELQKKWKNLKCCYFREVTRLNDIKNGSTSQKRLAYGYFDKLHFLKEVASNIECVAEPRIDKTLTIEPVEIPQLKTLPKKRKISESNEKENKNDDVIGNEFIKLLKLSIELREKRETDPDRAFLLSMLSDFKRVPDRSKLPLKIEMIRLIQNHQLQTEFPANCIQNEAKVNSQSGGDSSHIQELEDYPFSCKNEISDDCCEDSITVTAEHKNSEFINGYD